MSDMNIVRPIVNGISAYCKWFISAWKDDSFDFNSYFRLVNFCNKDEQYPKVIKSYSGVKGKIYLFNIPAGFKFKKINDARIDKMDNLEAARRYCKIYGIR